jgi:drug/metabolite transporter (DMT)-like permease
MSAGAPLILLATLFYGLNAAPAREAAGLGVGGADVVALRNILLLAVTGVVATALRAPLALPKEGRGALIGLGVASAMVGVGYITSVGYIPVGVAVMIFYTNPLLILLVSPFVDGARPGVTGLAGFALAFGGLALAIGPALWRRSARRRWASSRRGRRAGAASSPCSGRRR